MGPLVTINSATLMNKGLELIEAHLLFEVPLDEIDVVVHPQSVVHSMVEFFDGSTLAQVSPPDMRLPIALGMSWPDRVAGAGPSCDWSNATTWEFFPLDEEAFPAIGLARLAATRGGTAPAVFNGADEACVAAFLAGEIGFLDIVDYVARVLDEHLGGKFAAAGGGWASGNEVTLENVLAADTWARARAVEIARRPDADVRSPWHRYFHPPNRWLHRTPRTRSPPARQEVRRQGHRLHDRFRPHDLVESQG